MIVRLLSGSVALAFLLDCLDSSFFVPHPAFENIFRKPEPAVILVELDFSGELSEIEVPAESVRDVALFSVGYIGKMSFPSGPYTRVVLFPSNGSGLELIHILVSSPLCIFLRTLTVREVGGACIFA